MVTLNPYLNFPGTTEEAFNFYRSVFGGEFAGGVHRFRDMPDTDKLPEHEKDMVMHMALPIGNGNMLMGTDALESMGHKVESGNNISLSLHPESREEADELFAKLSAGGEVEVPMEDASWGDYFGMFTDKFGIKWMINYSESEGY